MSTVAKESDEPASLDARLTGPHVDLRALAAAALAASPLFAWNVADRLSYPYAAHKSALTIAVDQVQLIAWLITMSFGYSFVAVGVALFRQRRWQGLRRFSFLTTALRVAVLLVIANAVFQTVRLLKTGECSTELTCFMWRYELMVFVLSNTATLAVTIMAAHLYFAWRRLLQIPGDGARFLAIAAVSFMVTLVVFGWWLVKVAPSFSDPALTIFMVMLWATVKVCEELIWCTGVVFLYGFIAIALVRWWQVEDRLGWVTLAATAASLAHWLIVYGFSALIAASAVDTTYWHWSDSALRALLTSFVIGIVSGPIYLYFVDRAAWRRAIVDLPQTFEALRRWPSPPEGSE